MGHRTLHETMRATALSALVTVFLAAGGPGQAADGSGNFAVKGFGLRTCSDFAQARNGRTGAYLAYRSWLNGYITAYNQITPQTYDVGGKAGLENWLAWLGRYCADQKETPFVLAATALTAALHDQRLQAKAGAGTPSVTAHGAKTVRAIQKALKDKDLYDGAIDGAFGPGTRAALTAYQKAEGLSPTGQPDVPTLTSLFRGK